MPSRSGAVSRNILWEYDAVRRAGIYSQWLVSDALEPAERPRGDNVTSFDERHPQRAIAAAVARLREHIGS